MRSNKIVILIVFLLIGTGVLGAYYLFKYGQREVVAYSVHVADNILKQGDVKAASAEEVGELRAKLKDSTLATEQLIENANALFQQSYFQVDLLEGLKKIDMKDGQIDFTEWDKALEATKSGKPEMFHKIWSVIVKVAVLKKEQGVENFEVNQDYIKSLKSSI